MVVFRQFKRKKNGIEEIVDIGALAKNITEDSTHRFVSDAEKQKWNGKLDSAGDIASAKVSFSQAATRANINTGETVSTISGKLKKWYADFKTIVWTGSYSDLENKPALGSAASQGIANNLTTTAAGYAMDARQGPVIQQHLNQINSNLGGLSFYEDSSGKYVVGADSVPKKLGSVPIKGHLKAGRTRGGAGVGEITFYDIPKGTSIKISNLSLPYGPNNTINFYVKVNGNSILTTNGSYNITSDINTIIIYMYVYLSEEGSGGYGNCDYEIAF